uniref:Uncharacterized protein n=1 Tax=Romanomermis culicivorax TaxID=13658 RepID=A0A915I7U9_ROMCU
MKLVKIASNK